MSSNLTTNKKQYKVTPESIGLKSSMIENIPINSISWHDFKGTVPQNKPYYAHINWHITYTYYIQHYSPKTIRVMPKPHISAKSWLKAQHENDQKLLQHQYGHYLIGCLCCLNFQKLVQENNKKLVKIATNKEIQKQLQVIFQGNLNQYLKMQIEYDEETEHYYNREKQKQWEERIVREINAYYRLPVKSRNVSGNKNSVTRNLVRNVSSNKENASPRYNNMPKIPNIKKNLSNISIKNQRSLAQIPMNLDKVRQSNSLSKKSIKSYQYLNSEENQINFIDKGQAQKIRMIKLPRQSLPPRAKDTKIVKDAKERTRRESYKAQYTLPILQLR